MQVNIDTALVRDAIQKLVEKALKEATQPTSSLGESARLALKDAVRDQIAQAARRDSASSPTET